MCYMYCIYYIYILCILFCHTLCVYIFCVVFGVILRSIPLLRDAACDLKLVAEWGGGSLLVLWAMSHPRQHTDRKFPQPLRSFTSGTCTTTFSVAVSA